MAEKIRVDIPLSSELETYEFPLPCCYCGQPVNEGDEWWEKTIEYPLVKWGMVTHTQRRKFGRTHTWQEIAIVHIKDGKGQDVQGKVILKVPYCRRHRVFPKVLDVMSTIATIAGIIVAIGSFIGLLIVALSASEDDRLGLCLAAFLAPILNLFLTYAVLYVAPKWIVSRFVPEWRDIPSWGAGHFGLAIGGVQHKCATHGSGPFAYHLELRFSNPDSANRFVGAYPQASAS